MRRTVKLDWDYKILHTSGEKVVKSVEMTERFIQIELDCIDDLDAFIEDNNVQDLDEIDEAVVSLNKFEQIVARYNECHTELKLALGDKYQVAYGGRVYTASSRRYIRDLKTRSKELRKIERQKTAELEDKAQKQAAEEKDRDRLHAAELEEKRLQHADKLEEKRLQQAADEKTRDQEIGVRKLEASAGLAYEALMQCPSETSTCSGFSIPELERAIAEVNLSCDKFRMAHGDLAAILGDRYNEGQKEHVRGVFTEAQTKIIDLKNMIMVRRETQGNLAKKERQDEFDSKRVLGEQTVKEIEMRCDALSCRVGVTPTSLPDSQLLDLNKSLHLLDIEASKILDKITEYSGYVSGLGAGEQLIVINELLANTLKQKDMFILAVRQEVVDRDLSEEKIKNALGLKINIPKFTGYESPMDIYTFRTQFEKFVTPYVQKPLLPDTLKMNYLGDPALTMVKELVGIDEIWGRLTKSYGDARVLLQNKLGGLSKMGGLDKIRGEEKLILGISELVNVMAELSRLADKYHLESVLYHPMGGLGIVQDLMGKHRVQNS